jgi:hypothetical protein
LGLIELFPPELRALRYFEVFKGFGSRRNPGLDSLPFTLELLKMGFRLPSIPYPPARPDEGWWGDVTSTINWCEEARDAT